MTSDSLHQPQQPVAEPYGALETVYLFADGPMPTGVSVSRTGRIFVNFPHWGDSVIASVVELVDGLELPYPDDAWNTPLTDEDPNAFVSVQSVVVDPLDRLWILDTGSPKFKKTRYGGPKLVGVDLATNEVVASIVFQPEVVLPTSYLNDVRFDLRRGDGGLAFITDSSDQGPNGLIVVDLDTGEAWRRLHEHPSTKAVAPPEFVPIVEGRPFLERPRIRAPRPVAMGADGIAISADGARIHYCPLASRRWSSVSTDALADRDLSDDEVAATVVDEGDKGGLSDGLETDDLGRFYFTSPEHNAILRRDVRGTIETVAHDPRLLWPDTLAIAADGYLYVIANQLHRQSRYQRGHDLRQYPYSLFRVKIDARPVALRPA